MRNGRPGLLDPLQRVLMVLSLAACLLPGCGGDSKAKEPVSSRRPPRAVFPASYVDSQKHVNGFTTKTIVIPVRNAGEASLSIRDVRTDCDCIRVTARAFEIPGGEVKPIRIVFAPTHEVGLRRFKVSFQTNCPDTATGLVAVACNVLPPLVLAPAVCDISGASAETERTVKVLNHSPNPVRLLYATGRHSWLTIRVPSEPIDPGGQGNVTVLVRGFSDGRRRKGSATIAHDLSEVGPLTIAVQQGSQD